MLSFPKDFFWGSATSAYQVEGNNFCSDWWEWEKNLELEKRSGKACLHYELYKEDFNLAKFLNHNAHRLSIEWSRVESKEGFFLDKELRHYLEVIEYLRELRIEPIVTLHHFTNPLWLAKQGGWENKNSVFYFLRYVERLIHLLCEKVRFWITINEPIVYTYHGYIVGIWPPQIRSLWRARRVIENLTLAHIKAYKLIHNIYKRKKLNPPYVSIAQNLIAFVPCSLNLKNRFATYLRDRFYNFGLIERLIRAKSLDFIGINYYTRNLIDVVDFKFQNLCLDSCSRHNLLEKNSLGWEIYPEGLYDLLMRLKRYKLKIFILENGICTENDGLRWEFIYRHLENICHAIQEGAEILGYLYWSLLDNYEWDKGFLPRFGLIAVDYLNYRRTIRESAKRFALVCQSGSL
ncbi:MAG: glycoside hydrolase family 1 protein [Candidatus Omnitrophica bacterium]|nr:glycoside hydrolase family 1 protein [Candidatus Omnitrophota bacterium]